VPIDEGGVAPVGTHSHTLTPVPLGEGGKVSSFWSCAVVREGNGFFLLLLGRKGGK
jgi:hypothetical protein